MPLSDAQILEKLGNCVNPRVRSTHPSNISGGLRLSQGLRHVIRKCSNGTTPISERTRDRLQKLPPTPKNLGRCIRELNPSLKLLRLLRSSEDCPNNLQQGTHCVENRASSGSLSTSVGVC